ncbi:MAG TPA: hypothetical protein VHV83_21565 [Armatimonadota bacterium]|nr:hypothetical protein [Armatimonadota bacterium]
MGIVTDVGLGGAVILEHLLHGEHQLFVPAKGDSIYTDIFREELQAYKPDAVIVIDQGSRAEDLLPDVPTLTIDHHTPHGIPKGVYITAFHRTPNISSSHLCYQLAGEPEALLWLAAIGEIGDFGTGASSHVVTEASQRYTQLSLLEIVALINAARRSSRFDWKTAHQVLSTANEPGQIDHHEIPGAELLVADRKEVNRELQRARKAHPFFADPWAVIPFSSPCLIRSIIARAWEKRLHAHYVVAANFGYRPGEVFFSIVAVLPVDLVTLLREAAPQGLPEDWGHGYPSVTDGAVSRHDFLLLLTHLGFTPEQVIEIDRAATHPH